MATAVKSIKTARPRFSEIVRTRKECPENLSPAGKWMQEHPNGVAVIVNRRAVNR